MRAYCGCLLSDGLVAFAARTTPQQVQARHATLNLGRVRVGEIFVLGIGAGLEAHTVPAEEAIFGSNFFLRPLQSSISNAMPGGQFVAYRTRS